MKKNILRALLLVLVITASNFISPVTTKAQVGVSVSYQTFYDQLSPDGSWISNPDYGYVWVPNVDAGFKPYGTHGHWVYTDDGWVWASTYRWGWAAFHYGRWGYDDGNGWYWIPDYEWAPSWVVWGNSGDNYCWAPLGPRISFGVGFNWNPPARYWVSCPHQYMGGSSFGSHVIINNNTTIVRNINIIRGNNAAQVRGNANAHYHPGPAPAEVGKFTHRTITPARIVNNNTPGSTRVSNGAVSIYRPAVQRADEHTAKPKAIQPRENIHQNRIVNPAIKPQQPNPAQPANGQHPANRVNPAAPVKPQPNPAHPVPNPTTPANRTRPNNPVVPNTHPQPVPTPNPATPKPPRQHNQPTPQPNTPTPAPQRHVPTPRPVQPNNPPPQQHVPTPRPAQPNKPPPQQHVPTPRPVQPVVPRSQPPQQQHMPAPRPQQNIPHPPPQKPVQPPQKHDGPQ